MVYVPPTVNQQRATFIYQRLEDDLIEAKRGQSKAILSEEYSQWQQLIAAIGEAQLIARRCISTEE